MLRIVAGLLAGIFVSVSFAQDDAVVVTATRFADSKRNLPVGVSVITADDIRQSATSNLPEILAQYGLLHIRDNSGSPNQQIDLRGFGITGDQNTLVLVDGLRLSENELVPAQLSRHPARGDRAHRDRARQRRGALRRRRHRRHHQHHHQAAPSGRASRLRARPLRRLRHQGRRAPATPRRARRSASRSTPRRRHQRLPRQQQLPPDQRLRARSRPRWRPGAPTCASAPTSRSSGCRARSPKRRSAPTRARRPRRTTTATRDGGTMILGGSLEGRPPRARGGSSRYREKHGDVVLRRRRFFADTEPG